MIWYVFVNGIQGERKVVLPHINTEAVQQEASQTSAPLNYRNAVYPLSLPHHHAWLHSQPSLSAYQMVSRRLSGSFIVTQNLGKIQDSAGLDSDCRSRGRGCAKRQVTHRRDQSAKCIYMLQWVCSLP